MRGRDIQVAEGHTPCSCVSEEFLLGVSATKTHSLIHHSENISDDDHNSNSSICEKNRRRRVQLSTPDHVPFVIQGEKMLVEDKRYGEQH